MAKNNSQLINADSGNFEYYTPEAIIERARRTMGGINLDPFSSKVANKTVRADKIFTKEDDGFSQQWFGTCWVNHPFSRENNPKIFKKVVSEYSKANILQACVITYASTSEGWFRLSLKYPQCYLYGRTNYILPDGTIKRGVTKGSVVTYFGDDVESFYQNFKDIGEVKVPYEPTTTN